jgi:hypothetical protein
MATYFQRSIDTDLLTIRKVNALNSDNSVIPALRCLTADGNGGTYWATPSALGAVPALNTIKIGTYTYNATGATNNTLNISTTSTLGIYAINSSITFYGKSFTSIDVSGADTLQGFSNATETPIVKLASRGGISLTTDSATNTIFFYTSPATISTGVYAFNQISITSNSANPTETATLSALSPSTLLSIQGVGDIILSTNTTTNTFTIGISSFTSQAWQALSTTAYSAYPSSISTVSTFLSNYVTIETYGTGTSSLSTLIGGNITTLSTSVSDRITYNENYGMTNYLQKGIYQIFSTNLSTSLNSVTNLISTLDSGIQSGAQGAIGGPGDSVVITSANFRLDSMSSLWLKPVRPACQLTYSPSLCLTSNTSTGQLFYISTFLTYEDGTVLPSSLIVRPWIAPNGSGSNVYCDTIKMNINLLQAYDGLSSNYQIKHRISPFTSQFDTSTIGLLTFPKNALHVQLAAANL